MFYLFLGALLLCKRYCGAMADFNPLELLLHLGIAVIAQMVNVKVLRAIFPVITYHSHTT